MFNRAIQNPMKEQESSTKAASAVLRMTMTVDEMAAELNISRLPHWAANPCKPSRFAALD